MITCVVKAPEFGSEVVISYMYAFNGKEERKELWEEIKTLA